MRLQLRRPLATAAVFLAASGIAVIAAPPQAFADMRPATAVVSTTTAGRPVAAAPVSAAAAPAAPAASTVSAAAPAQDSDTASSPTLGETIKRIKLWQSLTSMGILVGALVLVKKVAVRR